MRGSIYLSTSDIWPYASVAFGRSGLVRGGQFYLSTSDIWPDARVVFGRSGHVTGDYCIKTLLAF